MSDETSEPAQADEAATEAAPAAEATPDAQPAPATAAVSAEVPATVGERPDESASSAADAQEANAGASRAEATVAPAAPEPPAAPVIRRQSLSLRGGSCDMRMGVGAPDGLGRDLRLQVGKPRRVLLVRGEDVTDELAELVRRSLVDAGFDVRAHSLPAGRASRSVSVADGVLAELCRAGITADDALVGIGDADVLSCLTYVSSVWCDGCALAAVPTTLDGMVDLPVTPRALDLGDAREMVRARGCVRLLVCDPSQPGLASATPGTLMGRAVMVAGAVAAGKQTFSDLALRAGAVAVGDVEAIEEEVLAIAKARARVASSSAIAIRQGMLYGLSLARALGRCLAEATGLDEDGARGKGEPDGGRLLAEGMRISARLAAAHQGPDKPELVDFVFAQDALLERLGLDEVPCDLDADRLLEALRAEELSRSNRFMLALPLDYGRVRLTSLDDELLSAHLHAWCKTRRRLKRKLV